MRERRSAMTETYDGDDFTFAAGQPPPRLLSAGAGGGFVGPPLLYPVFGRPRSPPRAADPAETEPDTATARVPLGRLLAVDRDPAPAPAPPPAPADDADSVPAEMFCPWSPGGWSAAAAAASPARCKKSGSTGSVLRWRPRLAVGRSQSDGKEKFVFLSAAAASGGGSSYGRRSQKGRRGAAEGAAAPGGTGAGAHAWSCYVDDNNRCGGASRRRRSFLPYKQDLVGLFANAAVFRRSYLPF